MTTIAIVDIILNVFRANSPTVLNAERMDRGDRLTLSAGTPIIPVYICIDQRVSQRRH